MDYKTRLFKKCADAYKTYVLYYNDPLLREWIYTEGKIRERLGFTLPLYDQSYTTVDPKEEALRLSANNNRYLEPNMSISPPIWDWSVGDSTLEAHSLSRIC